MTKQKKRGPKPKKKSDRIVPFGIGLSGDQISFVEREAKRLGVNTSEYVRTLIDRERGDRQQKAG